MARVPRADARTHDVVRPPVDLEWRDLGPLAFSAHHLRRLQRRDADVVFVSLLLRHGRRPRRNLRLATPAVGERLARRYSPRITQSLHSGLLRSRDGRY